MLLCYISLVGCELNCNKLRILIVTSINDGGMPYLSITHHVRFTMATCARIFVKYIYVSFTTVNSPQSLSLIIIIILIKISE